MTESIIIRNLGPLKNVNIEEIKPFTIFIGESCSGKSTVMKAIALFRWLYKMHNIRSYLKHSKMSKSPFRFRMETYLKNCGFEQYIKLDTEIIYTTKFSNGNSYELRFSNGKISGTSTLVKSSDLYFNKISFISETRNIIPLWSDKGASLAGGYLGFYFHEVYKDFDIASDNLRELDLNFLNLKFSVKRSQQGKKYVIQSGNKGGYEIDYKNSSSGTQTTVPISLITEYYSKNYNFEEAFNRSVFNYLSYTDKLTDFKAVKNISDLKKKIYIHIEEPELSLYPDAQFLLINDLINKCFISNKNSIELMLSTHSPYIVNQLNLLIKNYDKQSDNPGYDYDKLAVFQMVDGELRDLKIQNERLVNSNSLSDTINYIYEQFSILN